MFGPDPRNSEPEMPASPLNMAYIEQSTKIAALVVDFASNNSNADASSKSKTMLSEL